MEKVKYKKEKKVHDLNKVIINASEYSDRSIDVIKKAITKFKKKKEKDREVIIGNLLKSYGPEVRILGEALKERYLS